jgi:prepilin-type N-terminal cleavage/methylation domain-containing protein
MAKTRRLLAALHRVGEGRDFDCDSSREVKKELSMALTSKRMNQGFTLIELMIVVAIIAIIAAIAVPNLLSARLAANESNAIATLRNVVSSQAQFQQSAAIDSDGDGTGEYGFFGDMSGLFTLDSHSGPNVNVLNPPVLAASFRNIDAAGVVTKGGYCFRIYLPDAAGAGITEDGTQANGGQPLVIADANNCELGWCMYAWPMAFGSTGNRAFFVNQQGEIMFTLQAVNQAYTGVAAGPIATAAFIAGAAGMLDRLTPGVAAVDGETWSTL